MQKSCEIAWFSLATNTGHGESWCNCEGKIIDFALNFRVLKTIFDINVMYCPNSRSNHVRIHKKRKLDKVRKRACNCVLLWITQSQWGMPTAMYCDLYYSVERSRDRNPAGLSNIQWWALGTWCFNKSPLWNDLNMIHTDWKFNDISSQNTRLAVASSPN